MRSLLTRLRRVELTHRNLLWSHRALHGIHEALVKRRLGYTTRIQQLHAERQAAIDACRHAHGSHPSDNPKVLAKAVRDVAGMNAAARAAQDRYAPATPHPVEA